MNAMPPIQLEGIIFGFLIMITMQSCNQSIELPISTCYDKIESRGIVRYVYITFKDGHLYHDDSILYDLDYFRDHIYNYIVPNDGSNSLRTAFYCSRTTNYSLVDSVFNLLRLSRLSPDAYMVNSIDDSIGIEMSIPPIILPEWFLDTNESPFITVNYSSYHDSIFIDGSYVNKHHLDSILDSIINTDSVYVRILLDEKSTYQDFITLIDEYKSSYREYKDDLARVYFQKKYEDLNWYGKDTIDYISKKERLGIMLKYIVEGTGEIIYQ